MRDQTGKQLMQVWKIRPAFEWIVIAAWTRKEAFDFLKYQTNYIGAMGIAECSMFRVKDTFHSGNKIKV